MIARIYLVWILAAVEWYVLHSGLFKRCGMLNLEQATVGNSAAQMSLSYSPQGPIAFWEDPVVWLEFQFEYQAPEIELANPPRLISGTEMKAIRERQPAWDLGAWITFPFLPR